MGDQRKKITRQQRRDFERKHLAGDSSDPPSAHQPQLIRQDVSVEWRYYLPPPGLLRQYDFIEEGPERLLRLAEQQAKHRRKIENRSSWTEAFQRVWGSVSATGIAVGGVGGGIYLMTEGHGISGFAAFVTGLAILVSAVQGVRSARKSAEEPPPAEPSPQTELPLTLPGDQPDEPA